MKNFWQQLNRPLVVLLLGLALWPVVSAWKERLAVHATADAAFQELNRAEDQMNAQAKKSGIKKLVESFVSQFVEGFTEAFNKAGSGAEAKSDRFAATLPQVVLSDVGAAPSGWGGKEKIIGIIHNNSAVAIADVHLNLMLFAADGHLLNVLDEGLNELKLLEPGRTVGFSVDHDLSDPNGDADTDTDNSGGNDDEDEDGDDAAKKKPKVTAEARKAAADARKAAQNARKAAQNARRAVKVTAQVIGFDVKEVKAAEATEAKEATAKATEAKAAEATEAKAK